MANDALPPSVRLAQASAIMLAATTAGANAGLSLFVIPQILASSGRSAGAAARRWADMFGVTSRLFPAPMVFGPALLNAFLAYRIPGRGRGRARAVYAAVAAATLSIMPYTYVFLMPINRALLARTAKYDAALQLKKVGGGGSSDEDDDDDDDGDALVETQQDIETTHALVDKWGVRNLYRSAVSFLAGWAGLYAALSS